MIKFHKIFASVLGIGQLKGGGTVAAIVYCIFWYLLHENLEKTNWIFFSTFLIIGIGIWSANEVDAIWGKDSCKVVIDEVAGMAITLLLVPKNIIYLLIGLIAFRFFDIVKPLGIRKLEILPKGWGVMADDLLAGFYALTFVHLCIELVNKFA
jgi:phosphatidylglycerophosphatase A